MTYCLNARVSHCDFLRARSADHAHVKDLAKRNEILYLENVAVDVPNLIHRRFACDTTHCVRVKQRDGRKWYCGSCCTDLVVEVTDPEYDLLDQLSEAYLRKTAKSKSKGPKSAIQRVAKQIVEGDIFALTDKDEQVLDDHKSNRCILSWIDRKGVLRCTINSMVEALGWRIEDFKLDACFAYPIHYVDYAPGQWFLTIVNRDNYRTLGAAREAATMPCLTRPVRNAPPAYVWLRREIEHLWGADFWQQLDLYGRRLLAETKK